MPASTLLRFFPTALLLLAACPPSIDDQVGGSAQPDGSSGGSSSGGDPSETDTGTTDTPTTGADTTGVESTSTGEPGSSTGDGSSSTGEHVLPAWCPYDLAGVTVGLTASKDGASIELDAQACGAEEMATFFVAGSSATELELMVCAAPLCGECDADEKLVVSLELPPGVPGLPPQLAPGVCLEVDARWDKPTDEPGLCGVSRLATTLITAGQPEPIPRFLYRHAGALPASDAQGTFAFTGEAAPPGAFPCPCEGDCCEQQPGSLPVAFTAKFGQGEVGLLPLEPPDTTPAFLVETVEGDELTASVTLIRSTIPSACDAPGQHEWILRLVP